MQCIWLEYLPEFKAWGIKKDVIAQLKAQGQVAEIIFPKPEEIEKVKAKYSELDDFNYNPKASASTVGFLLGQDKADDGTEYYSISNEYARAMANTGTKIRFLDYENPAKQMVRCHGVVLPGGAFDSPAKFYVDSPVGEVELGKRYLAYEAIIKHAHKAQKPMLGICAGAQMIGALLGNMKMYHSVKDLDATSLTAGQHKPDKDAGQKVCPHMIQFKGPFISQRFKLPPEVSGIMMNSRHGEAMVHPALQKALQNMGIGEPKIPMEIYATTKDDIPEIWGNEKACVLCVQGHPEDYAKIGNDGQANFYQKIYDWVAWKSQNYKERAKCRTVTTVKRLGNMKGWNQR